MSKRNLILEILDKKQRLPFSKSRRWDFVKFRLNNLNLLIDLLDMLIQVHNNDESEDLFYRILERTNSWSLRYSDREGFIEELSKYIPIGLVSCIEGYFRISYADLINFGSPYKDNASRLDVKYTFTIETLLDLDKSSVTTGEIIAHILSTNNLDDINNTMSTILGNNFLSLIREERPKTNWQKQPALWPISEEERSDQIIVTVKRLFELRHMYAHEIDPPIERRDLSVIWSGVDAAIEFLLTTEKILNQLLSSKP